MGGTFDALISEALDDDYDVTNYPPDEAGQHGTNTRRNLFNAPVKSVKRMADKVGGQNCGICKVEAIQELAVKVIKQAGMRSKGKKGLPGLRNVAKALGVKDADKLAMEP